MMKLPIHGRRCATLAWATALLLAAIPASAQVPPHPPGTICQTPNFWCWVQGNGQPGSRCQCPSPYGPKEGRLI